MGLGGHFTEGRGFPRYGKSDGEREILSLDRSARRGPSVSEEPYQVCGQDCHGDGRFGGSPELRHDASEAQTAFALSEHSFDGVSLGGVFRFELEDLRIELTFEGQREIRKIRRLFAFSIHLVSTPAGFSGVSRANPCRNIGSFSPQVIVSQERNHRSASPK